jgi:flagellar protein FliO/FliZ
LRCLLATGTAFAEPMRAASPPPAVTSAGSLLQVVLALGVVVAAVYGVAWLLKRMSPLQHQGAGALRVVGATSVGQRERVVLVEINDTWLVVGVAPGQVNALHTLPKPAHAVPGWQTEHRRRMRPPTRRREIRRLAEADAGAQERTDERRPRA